VLTPLMLALIAASVLSGQVVSRTGRYRPVLLAGFLLLTQLDGASTSAEVTLDMVVVGLGIGLGMQTYVLAVQNASPPRMMGVATATTQFFRSVGGTIGVTAMGALLTARLHGGPSPGDLLAGGRGADTAAHRDALASAMHGVFVAGVPLVALAFVATLFVEARELRRTVERAPEQAGAELFDELGTEFEEPQPAAVGR
jgi:MFS family permease